MERGETGNGEKKEREAIGERRNRKWRERNERQLERGETGNGEKGARGNWREEKQEMERKGNEREREGWKRTLYVCIIP